MIPLISTAYLPSAAYMALLAQHDAVRIERLETFPKQTYRNRCTIATGNGVQTLTVPVVRPQGNHTRTEQMGISYQEPWNVRHWRAIVSAYNTAPYFLYYRDGLERLLMQRFDTLLELNQALLQYLLQKLKIDCRVEYTTDFAPVAAADDLRLTLTCKSSQGSALLPPYSQVFDDRLGFQPNLSVIDLLFNLGPEARSYLRSLPANPAGGVF